jgi:DNA-binding transcriptional MerR regulator
LADRDHRTEHSEGEATWTISELATQAGVTARTIRFYTLEGLLPPPDARTRYALYGETHLLHLRLIQRLKEAYLPLTAIREQLERLSDTEIRALLEEPNEEAERVEMETATTPASLVVKEQKSEGSAADYIARVLAAHGQTLPEVAAPRRRALLVTPPAAPPPPVPPPAAAPTAPAQEAVPSPAASPAFLKQRAVKESAVAPPEEPQGDTWERIVLSPGVELHIRVPDTPDAREKIDAQVRAAKSLFKSGK